MLVRQGLTTKQQDHQEAVWELLRTEVSYIRQLRVIIDVSISCMCVDIGKLVPGRGGGQERERGPAFYIWGPVFFMGEGDLAAYFSRLFLSEICLYKGPQYKLTLGLDLAGAPI